MSDIFSFSKARKLAEQVKKRQQANENALKFGRTKTERVFEATQNDKLKLAIDRHKFEEDE